MTSHFFIFGRTPALSAQELAIFFPDYQLVTNIVAQLESDITDPNKLIKNLGGTIKIAEFVGEYNDITAQMLAKILEKYHQNHLVFGLSWYGNDKLSIINLTKEVKIELTQKGIHSRFVAPEHGSQLSSVVIDKQNVIELIIIEQSEKFIIAKTVAIQPYEDWNKRDYGRPYSDAKHGMLPPKVARMAINITCGKETDGKVLADPFCGMGTVVAEAILSGLKVYGSDISKDVVTKAQENIDWLAQTYQIEKPNLNIFQVCDAVHLSKIYATGSLDAIVTEPFMGTPEIGEGRVDVEKAKNIIKGLEKMYLGCLKEWYQLLKPKGKVCIAFPSIKLGSTIINVKRPIDTCENLGYTKVLGPITYGREQAAVTRNFFVFEKNE